MSEDVIKSFLYKNLPNEMINGIEYDDPKTMIRVLKLIGINDEEAIKTLSESIPESSQEADNETALSS